MRLFSKSEITAAGLLVCLLCCSSIHAGKKATPIKEKPDFTKEGVTLSDGSPPNVLGTTGASGWIFYTPGANYSYDGVTQIYVTGVARKTPASGVLKKGDVILGAAAGATPKLFEKNAR